MAINTDLVAEKIFNHLRGKGFTVKSFNKTGDLVTNPQEATRFAVAEPNILVRLDLNKESVSLSVSKDYDDDNLRSQLKELAQDNLLSFDFRVFNKKIEPKGEKIDIAKKAERNMADVMKEASLGRMTGSSKTSYQPLESVKVVVRHKKAVNEEIRGARSRNIHSIFVQRGDERFKMAENNLQMARAMARHLYNGGEVHDSIGEAITTMAVDYRQLREFVSYVQRNKVINEDNQSIFELAVDRVKEIRETFKRLTGAKSYVIAVESLNEDPVDKAADAVSDSIGDRFTESHLDDKVINVISTLEKLQSRRTTFEESIMTAIESETFAGVKDLLSEDDVVDFASPEARLGHQVTQMGYSAKDGTLSNYLQNIGSKISNGGQLNPFEYRAVKASLLSAGQKGANASPVDAGKQYESFLNQFVD